MATINAGRVRPYYRGAWASGTTYSFFDLVTSGGNSYLCINTSGSPAGTAVTNTTYWALIAQKGATGATGPQGPKGDTGATGPQGPAGASGVLGTQVFTSSTSVVVPSGATKAVLSGCGGGGGGGYSDSGGHGACVVNYPVSVTAGATISITIGTGGAAASAGGTTSFGALLSLPGGGGAKQYSAGADGTGPVGCPVGIFGKRGTSAAAPIGYGVGGTVAGPQSNLPGRPGVLIVTWGK